jgi:hypothetical protein
MTTLALRFQRRFQIARICGIVLLASLGIAAWLRDQPGQNWAAGVGITALLILRASWRCPACSVPLPAIPSAKLPACKHCDQSFREN